MQDPLGPAPPQLTHQIKTAGSPFWGREEERGKGVFINQVVTGRVIGYFPRCVSLRGRLPHQSMNVETERAINDWNIPVTLINPKIHESIAQ